MHPNKSKTFARYQLMLAAFLLLAYVALLVGTTLARYRTESVDYLGYTAAESGSIFLQTDGWVFSEESGSMSFYIGNSTEEDSYPQRDQSVSVRLLASLSVAEFSGELVRLSVTDGTKTTVYTATPVPIAKGTAMYRTFGAGRAYLFQDTEGKELSWTLKGEMYSGLSAEIEIFGLKKPENPALLQLQAVGG